MAQFMGNGEALPNFRIVSVYLDQGFSTNDLIKAAEIGVVNSLNLDFQSASHSLDINWKS